MPPHPSISKHTIIIKTESIHCFIVDQEKIFFCISIKERFISIAMSQAAQKPKSRPVRRSSQTRSRSRSVTRSNSQKRLNGRKDSVSEKETKKATKSLDVETLKEPVADVKDTKQDVKKVDPIVFALDPKNVPLDVGFPIKADPQTKQKIIDIVSQKLGADQKVITPQELKTIVDGVSLDVDYVSADEYMRLFLSLQELVFKAKESDACGGDKKVLVTELFKAVALANGTDASGKFVSPQLALIAAHIIPSIFDQWTKVDGTDFELLSVAKRSRAKQSEVKKLAKRLKPVAQKKELVVEPIVIKPKSVGCFGF